MKALRFALPLLLLAALGVFLWRGLSLDPRTIPSVLVGKPAPAFTLSRLDNPEKMVSKADLLGKPYLLNVWASWCSACITEHPLLIDLSKRGVINLVGLDYKDTPDQAKTWLSRNGDPYSLVLQDPDGRVAIDYGVYGVPETFLIDANGVIQAKQIGPITTDFIQTKVLPFLAQKVGAQ
jgi:cytochrome c biogenesis protein CcmG, thiol:disulfide interchange protein DsbE